MALRVATNLIHLNNHTPIQTSPYQKLYTIVFIQKLHPLNNNLNICADPLRKLFSQEQCLE